MIAEDYIHPPWTQEQIDALNKWQQAGYVHPFTCANEHSEPRALRACESGWVCDHDTCGYTQHWAHAFMLNLPANPLISTAKEQK